MTTTAVDGTLSAVGGSLVGAGGTVGDVPTFVGHSGFVEGTLTISGLAVGDLVIMTYWYLQGAVPAGWTEIVTDLDGDFMWRFADAGMVASGWTESGTRRGLAWAYRGADPSTPFEEITVAEAVAGAGTFPSMDASSDNSLAFFCIGQADNGETEGFGGIAAEEFTTQLNASGHTATWGVGHAAVAAGTVSGATWTASSGDQKDTFQGIILPVQA